MACALPPLTEYAYCEWVSCEAYLGTRKLSDGECRAETDLARLSADLYRQNLLRGRRSGQEVYVRVTPQNVRLRVTRRTDDQRTHEDLDAEMDLRSIARCTTGHDPFPQVVVVVFCLGLRPVLSASDQAMPPPASRAVSQDMRCHGIACANAWNASRLAKTMARAFQDLHMSQIQPQPPSLFPTTDQRLNRYTVSSIASPFDYGDAIALPPAYGTDDVVARQKRHNPFVETERKGRSGLPDVGSL